MWRVFVATALTFSCLAVATVAKAIGTVLAYNGSIFATPICFIMPCVMYLCLSRQRRSKASSLLCVMSVPAACETPPKVSENASKCIKTGERRGISLRPGHVRTGLRPPGLHCDLLVRDSAALRTSSDEVLRGSQGQAGVLLYRRRK